MIRVRKHQRQLASGKTTTVRQHERQGTSSHEQATHEDGSWWDGSGAEMPAGDYPKGTSFFRQDDDVFAVHPDGSVHPVTCDDAAEPGQDRHERTDTEFTRMQGEMRQWRSRDVKVPPAEVDASPLGKVLGTDTQEGADKFARLSAYRDAGYLGPLDQDNRIPDPDDPANHGSLHALADLRANT